MGGVSIGILPGEAAGWPTPLARRLVERCETSGLDHLGAGDHISFWVGAGSDGLSMANRFLSLSDRLAVNTAVYLLPLRHPVVVARQLADIAAFAPGRFTFGVGIGGEDPHEYEVCGVDPSTRGRRMDECIEIIRALLAGDTVDHDTQHFRLEQATIAPAPSVEVPIIVGGRSDAALQRAGRLGDGWMGLWVSPERYAASVATMHEAAATAGRDQAPSINGLNVWCGLDADETAARTHVAEAMQAFYQLPYERFERWSPFGTPERVAEVLAPYGEAGCSIFNLIAVSSSPEAAVDRAAEVATLLREHVGS